MTPILSRTFNAFFASEKSAGILLALCTVFSLVAANSPMGPAYLGSFHASIGGLSVEQWINDGLMAVFFLFVGLELERELYNGELSNFRHALLPIIAAVGGMAVPTLIHLAINAGTSTQAGAGIPMATDIAFALAVLALLGSRIPASLKVFLTALAVIDDLGAIVAIAVFYADSVSIGYLSGALGTFAILLAMNRLFRVLSLPLYLLGGAIMWICLLKSGVHATVAGVLLAFAVPFSARAEDEASPSHRLENRLHKPVAFLILPAFALANTGVVIASDWHLGLLSANSLGIGLGLVVGKPLGVLLFSAIAVALGICRLPDEVTWRHVLGAGMLAGIGFTMSIFVANLAFAGRADMVDASKLAILVASGLAAGLAYAWLRFFCPTRSRTAE